VLVAVEGVAQLDLTVDAPNGEVHFAQPVRCGVAFLAIHGDVADFSAVGFDKLFALYEHSARSTASVVDATLVGLEHLYKQFDNTLRCVELSAALTLRVGEHAEEVFVDLSE